MNDWYIQDDYNKIQETGAEVTAGREQDPQYMFLAQRLQVCCPAFYSLHLYLRNSYLPASLHVVLCKLRVYLWYCLKCLFEVLH